MIAAGLGLFILSLISFGDSWRIGIDTRSAGDLVMTGVFSLTRNPIFLFLDVYFLGTWLIYPNLFFGVFVILTAAAALNRATGGEFDVVQAAMQKALEDVDRGVRGE